MKAVLDHSKREAKNITSFWFRPSKPIRFEAGQFIELSLPHDKIDNRGSKRWFTLSSSPSDLPLVSITTKFTPKRSSSFKSSLRLLKTGDEVDISEPMGDFILPKDFHIPLVFIAGGIGITPFHSIIKFLSDTRENRSIQLIYSVFDPAERAFGDLFSKFIFANYFQPDAKEKLSAQAILSKVAPIGNKLLYISGPEIMVEKLVSELEKLGVPKAQLVGDYFPNYARV